MKRFFRVPPLIIAMRPTQWLKNCILYTSLVFNGQLFDPTLSLKVSIGFIAFCCISSASYVINDIKDLPYDSKHIMKRHRPIASGAVKKSTALISAAVLLAIGFFLASTLSSSFFLVSAIFFLLHILYTFYFKRHAVIDILMIALFFTLRSFAGEIITGLHISVWLMLTIVFLSLFIASAKRHSELLRMGQIARPALDAYRERLLDFYATTFATATVISYSLFVFFEEPPPFHLRVKEFLYFVFPLALERKWLILTVPFVLVGIMRYAQIVYEKQGAEAPERLITTDKPLLTAILGWGFMVILLLYLV